GPITAVEINPINRVTTLDERLSETLEKSRRHPLQEQKAATGGNQTPPPPAPPHLRNFHPLTADSPNQTSSRSERAARRFNSELVNLASLPSNVYDFLRS